MPSLEEASALTQQKTATDDSTISHSSNRVGGAIKLCVGLSEVFTNGEDLSIIATVERELSWETDALCYSYAGEVVALVCASHTSLVTIARVTARLKIKDW